MPEMHFLQDLLILFGMGVIMVVAFHRLNLPPVLSFLITGTICGPYGLKLVEDGRFIETLAEIGLVLLLFEAGIEFSIATFFRLKKFLLIAGGLQLLLTIGSAVLIGRFFDAVSWQSATFIGMLASLSSTAIVLRILEYRGDIETTHGRAAFSILIFQDLCLVPLVLITPFLGGQSGDMTEALLVMGKALLFLILAAGMAIYLVPWFLNQVAKTKRREAFVLSIILLCLGTATATSHFGLSMALGAFIAGLIISESRYNYQALGEILPFREVFNCLVFVSIGMLFDVKTLLSNPALVLTCLVVVITVKAFIGGAVTALAGHSWKVAILTGVTIAQVSEFSFVLAKLGLKVGLLDSKTNQLVLAVAILSMFCTPAVIALGHKLVNGIERLMPKRWLGTGGQTDGSPKDEWKDHVIIVGYSLAGQNLAQALKALRIPYVVVEQDPDVVREELAKGSPIFYGDAIRQEVLAHAGIARARMIVFTISDPDSCLKGVALSRRLNPVVRIIARIRSLDQVQNLVTAGAEKVISEEFTGSLEVISCVLQNYSVSQNAGELLLSELRDQQTINWQILYEKRLQRSSLPGNLAIELRELLPNANGSLSGHTLCSELQMRTGVTVVAIQRADGTFLQNPSSIDSLQPGDTAVLLGTRNQLSLADRIFTGEGKADELAPPLS